MAKDKKADEAKQEERPVRAKQAKSAESSEVADAVAVHIKPHYMRIFSIFYTIGEILTS